MTKPTAPFVTKIAAALVTAILIWGGSSLVASANEDAVQNQRLDQLEKNGERMDALSAKLDVTNTNVAVLNERLRVSNEAGD